MWLCDKSMAKAIVLYFTSKFNGKMKKNCHTSWVYHRNISMFSIFFTLLSCTWFRPSFSFLSISKTIVHATGNTSEISWVQKARPLQAILLKSWARSMPWALGVPGCPACSTDDSKTSENQNRILQLSAKDKGKFIRLNNPRTEKLSAWYKKIKHYRRHWHRYFINE